MPVLRLTNVNNNNKRKEKPVCTTRLKPVIGTVVSSKMTASWPDFYTRIFYKTVGKIAYTHTTKKSLLPFISLHSSHMYALPSVSSAGCIALPAPTKKRRRRRRGRRRRGALTCLYKSCPVGLLHHGHFETRHA